ncbi:MAG: hypothetical protein PHH63_04360 [Bacteroidales bacterium]|jgi:hypothetical protein|nr:hypothetical protein [Bacteroidales bacterium]
MLNPLYFVFLLPALYQLIIGSMVLKNKLTIPIMRVSIISIITLEVMLGVYLYKAYPGWKQTGSDDGLISFIWLSTISIIVLGVIMIIQLKASKAKG